MRHTIIGVQDRIETLARNYLDTYPTPRLAYVAARAHGARDLESREHSPATWAHVMARVAYLGHLHNRA